MLIGKKECSSYVGRLEGNLASLSPEGAREDTVGTKALVAETSKNGPSKANSGRCERYTLFKVTVICCDCQATSSRLGS